MQAREMHALESHFQQVDLSYTYDALTIYTHSDIKLKPALVLAINECNQYVFSLRFFNQDAERIGSLYSDLLSTSTLSYERSVHREDDDHAFYHHDHFQWDNHHYHIKFHQMLTRQQFEAVLTIFVEHHILSRAEKQTYLYDYDNRFTTARRQLNALLNGSLSDDTMAIISMIGTLGDNDILADLHQYLLNEQFDYLRGSQTRSSRSSPWQGTNIAGDIVTTNEAWAMIEKAFTLQMAANIRAHMRLTPAVGAERAHQLSETHRFFSMKRKSSAPATQFNKVSHSLSLADGAALERSYAKHFEDHLFLKRKREESSTEIQDPSTSERPTKRIKKY